MRGEEGVTLSEDGKFVVCRACSEVKGQEITIQCRAGRDFSATRWMDHKKSKGHESSVNSLLKGKKQASLVQFFGKRKEPPTNVLPPSRTENNNHSMNENNKRPRKSCEGIPPNAKQFTELFFYYKKYGVPSTRYVLGYISDGIPSLFSPNCTNNGVKRVRTDGLRCEACESVRQKMWKAVKQNLKKKKEKFEDIEQILAEPAVLPSSLKNLQNFLKTNKTELSNSGI